MIKDRLKNKKGFVEVNLSVLLSDDMLIDTFYNNFHPISSIQSDRYGCVKFLCLSSYFDDVTEGNYIPVYEVFFETHNNNHSVKEVCKL